MEISTTNYIVFKIIRSRLAEKNVEARLVFQECQIRDFSDDDDTQPLFVAVQRQNHFVHGQVCFFFIYLTTWISFAWTRNIIRPIRSCFWIWILNTELFEYVIWLKYVISFRLTLKLSCAMNFLIYPHDTQECKLQMESRKG